MWADRVPCRGPSLCEGCFECETFSSLVSTPFNATSWPAACSLLRGLPASTPAPPVLSPSTDKVIPQNAGQMPSLPCSTPPGTRTTLSTNAKALITVLQYLLSPFSLISPWLSPSQLRWWGYCFRNAPSKLQPRGLCLPMASAWMFFLVTQFWLPEFMQRPPPSEDLLNQPVQASTPNLLSPQPALFVFYNIYHDLSLCCLQ